MAIKKKDVLRIISPQEQRARQTSPAQALRTEANGNPPVRRDRVGKSCEFPAKVRRVDVSGRYQHSEATEEQ